MSCEWLPLMLRNEGGEAILLDDIVRYLVVCYFKMCWNVHVFSLSSHISFSIATGIDQQKHQFPKVLMVQRRRRSHVEYVCNSLHPSYLGGIKDGQGSMGNYWLWGRDGG